MATLLLYPSFHNRESFVDQLFRAVWLYAPVVKKIDQLVFLYSGNDVDSLNVSEILSESDRNLPEDFDPRITEIAPNYLGKILLASEDEYYKADKDLKGVIVWNTSDASHIAEAQRIAKDVACEVVLADPDRTQQETLLTIRFAYSLWAEEELNSLVKNSYTQFTKVHKELKDRPIRAFGNGPSLKKIVDKKIDAGPTIRAVCNSTISDAQALDHLNPQLLFCGDPVQHCGVSLYAGQFRRDLAKALEHPNRYLFTQLGYVPYFRLVTSSECHHRIIGIGNDRRPKFNLNLLSEYLSTATANIFTMLVLPVALTLTKSIDIYGCDGMSFASATKPWSHTNEDDYMSKMSVTHRVHRGFWRRNYEEEYWSYSRDLCEMLDQAESEEHTIRVRTPSFVPALAKRFDPLPC